MQLPKRTTLLLVTAVVLYGLVAIWWYFGFSVDFMRFWAADPGVTSPTLSASPSAASGATNTSTSTGMVACSPEQATIAVNQSVRVNASGGTGSNYQWFAPEGTVAMPDGGAGSTGNINFIAVVYATPGTKKITIQGPRANDPQLIDSAVCTVVVN